ncbi:MAG: hypothetical protein LBB45_06060 [Methanobrevibacter sp.]|jgi:hypothetical protein|nr:hypothetical protein [Candidatus Methanovirga basalitermitum]
MIKYGIDLTLPIEKYKIKHQKSLFNRIWGILICLDKDITKEIAIPLI